MKLVFIDRLEPGMRAGEDILSPEDDATVLVRKDTPLTGVIIQGLSQRGIRFVHIDDTPRRRRPEPTYIRNAQRPVQKLYVPDPRPAIAPALRETALDDIQELFGSAGRIGAEEIHDSALVIKHLNQVVDELVDSVQSDPSALVNITDLKSYDEYTFHHSLSVAVLSLAMGQHLGFDRETMRKLGMSSIMHDIGKTKVPIELIHKTSRLSDEEFEIIKGHSPAGFDYLRDHRFGGEILEAVLYHHEKADGTGYPDGLEGEQIPVWSRIISVADVYDALTSNRPYREPMQPGEAIEYIMGSIGTAFDYDVAKAFVEKVELYPVGRSIQLSDGATAKVLNNEHPMRPLIRLDDSGRIIDLYRDRAALSLVVSRLLPVPVRVG